MGVLIDRMMIVFVKIKLTALSVKSLRVRLSLLEPNWVSSTNLIRLLVCTAFASERPIVARVDLRPQWAPSFPSQKQKTRTLQRIARPTTRPAWTRSLGELGKGAIPAHRKRNNDCSEPLVRDVRLCWRELRAHRCARKLSENVRYRRSLRTLSSTLASVSRPADAQPDPHRRLYIGLTKLQPCRPPLKRRTNSTNS